MVAFLFVVAVHNIYILFCELFIFLFFLNFYWLVVFVFKKEMFDAVCYSLPLFFHLLMTLPDGVFWVFFFVFPFELSFVVFAVLPT